MPQYRLRLFHGPTVAGHDRVVDLLDDEAAFRMGKQICVAVGKDKTYDAVPSASLRVEIFSDSGRLLFRVAATRDLFDKEPLKQKPRIIN